MQRSTLQVAAAPPTTLLSVLSAPMAFYLISSAAPFTPAANGPLPAGLGPGVFCPDFSLAAGGEKARLFRISMTMACNAVTGVGGRPPAKFLVSSKGNKVGRQLGGLSKYCSTTRTDVQLK